jgi:6-phosphofructokinase 1
MRRLFAWFDRSTVNCGYLALMAGIAVVPRSSSCRRSRRQPMRLRPSFARRTNAAKRHAIAVVAEGARQNAAALAAHFREHQADIGFDLRTTTLGHVQRGGEPTAYVRLLATQLGAGAVDAFARGAHGVLTGLVHGRVTTTALRDVAGKQKQLNPDVISLAAVLARSLG